MKEYIFVIISIVLFASGCESILEEENLPSSHPASENAHSSQDEAIESLPFTKDPLEKKVIDRLIDQSPPREGSHHHEGSHHKDEGSHGR